MNLDTFGTYRVAVFELERATELAERQRMIAERAGVVAKDGIWRRMMRRRAAHRTAASTADCPAGARCALADA